MPNDVRGKVTVEFAKLAIFNITNRQLYSDVVHKRIIIESAGQVHSDQRHPNISLATISSKVSD